MLSLSSTSVITRWLIVIYHHRTSTGWIVSIMGCEMTGRTMRRHRDQKILDPARRQANTKQAKLDRRRRQHLMERSFADASNLHGFKRARWRGLIKQSIQDLLIATVQNLRKLIGAIQNAPESARKRLIRTLSRLYALFSALLTPDPPRQRVLAST